MLVRNKPPKPHHCYYQLRSTHLPTLSPFTQSVLPNKLCVFRPCFNALYWWQLTSGNFQTNHYSKYPCCWCTKHWPIISQIKGSVLKLASSSWATVRCIVQVYTAKRWVIKNDTASKKKCHPSSHLSTNNNAVTSHLNLCYYVLTSAHLQYT